MNILKLCGTAVLIVCLAFILKNTKKEFSTLLSLIFSIIVIKYGLNILTQNTSIFNSIISNSIFGEYGTILLKVMGITLIIDSVSDICKDVGESSIASKIETAGKIEILILSFPILNKILLILQETML